MSIKEMPVKRLPEILEITSEDFVDVHVATWATEFIGYSRRRPSRIGTYLMSVRNV
jgi:hypothetical protein